jgi:hypothetical protein
MDPWIDCLVHQGQDNEENVEDDEWDKEYGGSFRGEETEEEYGAYEYRYAELYCGSHPFCFWGHWR